MLLEEQILIAGDTKKFDDVLAFGFTSVSPGSIFLGVFRIPYHAYPLILDSQEESNPVGEL